LHSNVYREWQAMGEPKWPSSVQLADLHQHDVLETLEEPRELMTDPQGQTVIDFEMPMPALSLLILEPVK
jgi:xylan 1,4-beta-xylosidase